MRSRLLLFVLLLTAVYSTAQNQRSFNQNASRSNHTRNNITPGDNGFFFRLTGDYAKANADSIASKAVFMPGISAGFYSGNFGIGAEFGSFQNSPHFSISDYTQHINGFTTADITSSQWKSWYLLAGPSYRKAVGPCGQTGHFLLISADLNGGIMKMKPASFSIYDTQEGTLVADYYGAKKQSTSPESPLFAIKPNLRAEWFPGGGAIGVNVHASYLHAFGAGEISTYYRDLSKVKYDGLSQQEIRAQVLNAPVIESRTKGPVDNFGFGVGISIRIGSSGKGITEKGMRRASINKINGADDIVSPRDAASGLPTGRRAVSTAGVKRTVAEEAGILNTTDYGRGIVTPRDAAGGLPTGRRTISATGTDGITIDEQGVYRMMNQSCGPVTRRITNSDGSTEEMTFACTDDAASYNERISMNVTTGRQTQGSTFGEKVNAGLHAAGSVVAQGVSGKGVIHRDVAARNTISGRISFTEQESNDRIITNTSPAGNAKQSLGAGFGERVSIGIRAAVAGKADSKKKYGLIFADQGNAYRSSLGSVNENPLYQSTAVVSNPLYEQSGSAGDNPLFEGKMGTTQSNPLYQSSGNTGSNPLYQGKSAAGEEVPGCKDVHDPVADLSLALIDVKTGILVSDTRTGTCGDFFFANVPDGEYIVKVTGNIIRTKGYDITATSATDLAGLINKGDQRVQIRLNIAETNTNAAKEAVPEASWSTVKELIVYNADVNGDGVPEMLLGGAIPGGVVIPSALQQPAGSAGVGIKDGQKGVSAIIAGNPIGGIIVKGGKNPGGGVQFTVQTNENGQFEWKGLDAGNYFIKVEEQLLIEDETLVILHAQEQRRDWDGSVKGTVLPDSDPQQKSINEKGIKRSIEPVVMYNQTKEDVAQNNKVNTTKSNTKDFLVSLDELEQLLEADRNAAAALNKIKEDIRLLRSSIDDLDAAGTVHDDRKNTAVDTNFAVLLGSVNNLGENYRTISNVLKTKHDTAKNSVSNIR